MPRFWIMIMFNTLWLVAQYYALKNTYNFFYFAKKTRVISTAINIVHLKNEHYIFQ